MIIPQTRGSRGLERPVASDYLKRTVVECHTAGLGFVQDAGFLGFLLCEGVDCEWVFCCLCEPDGGAQVCFYDWKDRAEEFFGEQGVAWLDSRYDCWGEEPGCAARGGCRILFGLNFLEETVETVTWLKPMLPTSSIARDSLHLSSGYLLFVKY